MGVSLYGSKTFCLGAEHLCAGAGCGNHLLFGSRMFLRLPGRVIVFDDRLPGETTIEFVLGCSHELDATWVYSLGYTWPTAEAELAPL